MDGMIHGIGVHRGHGAGVHLGLGVHHGHGARRGHGVGVVPLGGRVLHGEVRTDLGIPVAIVR